MRRKIKFIVKYILPIIVFVCSIFIVKSFIRNDIEYNTASRWDKTGNSAHIGVYFSEKAEFTEKSVREFRENLKNKLQENDVLQDSKNTRSWADCYSSEGTINVSNNNENVQVKAIGVGGDFFLFHPLELVDGTYFSDDNIMKDLIVIDEDLAWRLYGSSNIQGKKVLVNGEEYIVAGVIKRDNSGLNNAAGNSKTTVYISLEALYKNTQTLCISSYEAVMPNLTKGYAYNIVKENIKNTKNLYEIKEISNRYSLIELIKIIKKFSTRSMKTNNIVYPYWENVSRGKEDICAVIVFLDGIIALGYVIFISCKIVKLVKNNKNNFKKVLPSLANYVKINFRDIL